MREVKLRDSRIGRLGCYAVADIRTRPTSEGISTPVAAATASWVNSAQSVPPTRGRIGLVQNPGA